MQLSIDELRRIGSQQWSSIDKLGQLLFELEFRSTRSAAILAEQVRERVAALIATQVAEQLRQRERAEAARQRQQRTTGPLATIDLSGGYYTELWQFQRLFEAVKPAYRVPSGGKVRIDLTNCEFLGHGAVALLGGSLRLLQDRGVRLAYLQPRKQAVWSNLERNGLARLFGDKQALETGNTVPFRVDPLEDREAILRYLKAHWLGRDWIHVSDALRNAIVGKVWEIYANAFEHGRSQVGVFSCGQHYPRKKMLDLAVVDLGVGIPDNVRSFLRQPAMHDSDALRWAFAPGQSTGKSKIARGLGLDLLTQFVKLNQGQLTVFSGSGYVVANSDGVEYHQWNSSVPGTLVNISLHCDERYYVLAGEQEGDFSFT